MRRPRLLLAFLPAAIAMAGLGGSYILPLDHEAIQYAKGAVSDPVSRLEERLEKGEVRLRYEDEFGYLRSVLKELRVPTSSQVLVFSKTSFQAPRIAPRTPRALYFNDDVTVGFVRTGDVLEFATLDPKQGTVFYTLDQEQTAHPHFQRRDVCLQCHQSGATLGVPGLVVRSVTPDHNGMPVTTENNFLTDHRSPLKERWGGWYVTGNTGTQTHMGNIDGAANVTDLRRFIDPGAYLTPHSDVVALMTLEHQAQMENLLIRVGWEARIAMQENDAVNKSLGEPEGVRPSTQHRIDTAVEELLGYLFFSGEAKLTSPVKGTSAFAEEFAKAGPRDAKGRSLRDFDLHTRMFRYPCSYMIYSNAFKSLPPIVKDRLRARMEEVLSGKDTSAAFAHLSAADRTAIREILQATL